MRARFIQEVGTRASLRVYWGATYWDSQAGGLVTPANHCPNCKGLGRPGYHNAERHLADSPQIGHRDLGGTPDQYSDDAWPAACDHCGAPVPTEAQGAIIERDGVYRGDGPLVVHRQVFRRRLYNTPSGVPEPGDLFWLPCPGRWGKAGGEPWGCPYWDNCTGMHLHAILPSGHEWDIDSRASNCTMPKDRHHRCWVRHGDPPLIHVDKGGHTCQAGAGSIGVPGWHGFLHHGVFHT